MSFCLSQTQCVCPTLVKTEFFTDLKRFGVHVFLKTDHVLMQSSKPQPSASRDESNYLFYSRLLIAFKMFRFNLIRPNFIFSFQVHHHTQKVVAQNLGLTQYLPTVQRGRVSDTTHGTSCPNL